MKRTWTKSEKFSVGDKLLWTVLDDQDNIYRRVCIVKEELEDSLRAVILKKNNRYGASLYISTWNENDFRKVGLKKHIDK